MDEDEQGQTEEFDENDEQQGDGSGSDDSAPPRASGSEDKSDKRVNDLMGNWQREQARANKAEAELARLKAAKPSSETGPAGNADADEFVNFAREEARARLFNSDPRLSDYGLSVEDIAGDSLAEMKASLAARTKMVDGIEAKAREKVLREHGLDPEVGGGAALEGPSFSTMSDKDFAEFLAKRDRNPY